MYCIYKFESNKCQTSNCGLSLFYFSFNMLIFVNVKNDVDTCTLVKVVGSFEFLECFFNIISIFYIRTIVYIFIYDISTFRPMRTPGFPYLNIEREGILNRIFYLIYGERLFSFHCPCLGLLSSFHLVFVCESSVTVLYGTELYFSPASNICIIKICLCNLPHLVCLVLSNSYIVFEN